MDISPDKMERAKKAFLGKCENVDKDSLLDAFYGSERKINKLNAKIPSSLKDRWDEIVLLTSMLKDYCNGENRDIPWKTIATISAALIYFVSPVDAIPDFIAGLGFVDDASVIALCVGMVQKDIVNYKETKKQ